MDVVHGIQLPGTAKELIEKCSVAHTCCKILPARMADLTPLRASHAGSGLRSWAGFGAMILGSISRKAYGVQKLS